MDDTLRGSGHPTLHPNWRHIVTDAYTGERVAFGDGTVPIRLADLSDKSDKNLVRIQTLPDYKGPKNELRVDPHPAWDYQYKRVAFNGFADGTRRVYVADLTSMVAG